MEQVLPIVGLVLAGVWVIAMVVIQIWYLIASFRASVGWTFASLFIPFVGIYMLVRFWQELKKPFAYNLTVGLGGLALMMVWAIVFKGTLPTPQMAGMSTVEEQAPAVPDIGIEPLEPVGPATPIDEVPTVVPAVTPVEIPPQPPQPSASGDETPLSDTAVVTAPAGWQSMDWTLPHLAAAMGDPERGEFVTLHAVDKEPGRTFEAFQAVALAEIREHLIKAGEPGAVHQQTVDGCPVASRGLVGRSVLPSLPDQPMSARLSCVEGQQQDYYLVQWRNKNWDAQSQKNFDGLLKSFVELDEGEADL